MRDGINLAAHVYMPKERPGPLPAVFCLTPYGGTYSGLGHWWARRGYVLAAVDNRGGGRSEGEFNPYENEGRDGHDVVEWSARQPWSNSKAAIFGGSYLELGQWPVIKEFLIDTRELHKEWYDWTLKDGKRPAFLKKNIAYDVMGAEVWNYADRFDAIPSTPLRLYLRGKERSADVGSLSKKHSAQSTSRKHPYDPLDTRPGEFEIPQGEANGAHPLSCPPAR
jgi:predicted acyl esterase